VNAAVSDDRGVVIRAGSGAGSLVSDDGSTRALEHVSANKKASLPAQDRKNSTAPSPPGPTNRGESAAGWATSVVVALSDVLPGCGTSADMENECWTEGDPSAALAGVPMAPPTAGPRPREAQPIFLNRHLTEDEQGISAKFPEVKGDGAMRPLLLTLTAAADGGADRRATTPALAPAPTPASEAPPLASARNLRLLGRNHQ
jgi:hypothetical protein